jgi:Putative viral replication protein
MDDEEWGDLRGAINTRVRGVEAYMICEEETAPGTGRKHYQGYIHFKTAKGFQAVKKLFGIDYIHLEVAKGTCEQNERYCAKEGTAWRVGIDYRPQKQGKRTDLHALALDIINNPGAPLLDFMQQGRVASAQQLTFAKGVQEEAQKRQELLQRRAAAAWKPVNVRVYWGATGTGKSTQAHADASRAVQAWVEEQEAGGVALREEQRWFHTKTGSDKWFPMPESTRFMVWDDFRIAAVLGREGLGLEKFLAWLSGAPTRFEFKGGHVVSETTDLWITTTENPAHWHAGTKEQVGQILRRITEVKQFRTQHAGASSALWRPSSVSKESDEDETSAPTPRTARGTRTTMSTWASGAKGGAGQKRTLSPTKTVTSSETRTHFGTTTDWWERAKKEWEKPLPAPFWGGARSEPVTIDEEDEEYQREETQKRRRKEREDAEAARQHAKVMLPTLSDIDEE